MWSDKEYEATIRLDGVSETDDAEGPITPIEVLKQPTETEIEDVIRDNFLWSIIQLPPAYSALKVDGKKAYELARKWKKAKLKEREVFVHENQLVSYEFPEIKIRLKVSTGTYIRSIARDLGQQLAWGWYITSLRRTTIWSFTIDHPQLVADLDVLDPDACAVPYEEVLTDIPFYDGCTDAQIEDLFLWKKGVHVTDKQEWLRFIQNKRWDLSLIDIKDSGEVRVQKNFV